MTQLFLYFFLFSLAWLATPCLRIIEQRTRQGLTHNLYNLSCNYNGPSYQCRNCNHCLSILYLWICSTQQQQTKLTCVHLKGPGISVSTYHFIYIIRSCTNNGHLLIHKGKCTCDSLSLKMCITR